MPSHTLPKNLSLCFSIIKRPRLAAAATAISDDDNRRSASSATNHFKAYNSLYESKPAPDDNDDDENASRESTPDLATAYASHRFFFSSPGRSNSIVDSSSASSTSEPEPDSGACSALGSGACPALDSGTCPEPDSGACPAPDSGVAVDTYSPDPYADFRRSMEEMVEARGLRDVRESWDGLHQLLLCYLSLNPKPTHQFIVAAFSDLLVSLMPLSQPPTRDASHVGSCRCSSH